MRRSKKLDKIKEELDALHHLIVQLDSLRAFRRVDPETVKASFVQVNSKDLAQEWASIKKDVEKIAYMPLEIPRIPTLMKLALILKFIFPLTVIPSFLILMSRFFSRSGEAPFQLDERMLIILLAVPLIIGQSSLLLDFKIRRTIANYEGRHPEKFSVKREKLKAVTQKAVKKLGEKIERYGEDSANYKLTLYFNDYENLKIIKESRGRIFKTKYYKYTAVPSIKK